MLITAIAPEYLLFTGINGLAAADMNFAAFQKLAMEDGAPWTLGHSIFAGMGGFVIKGRSAAKATVDPDIELSELRLIGTEISPEANSYPMSNTRGSEEHNSQLLVAKTCDSHPNPFHVNATQLLALRHKGIISSLPNISVEELHDKSKSDSFPRIITVAQILWLTFQVIIRKASGLAISQLELAAVAFSACAVIIYGVDWNKPKNVQVPHVVLLYDIDRGIPLEIFRTCEKATAGDMSNIHEFFGLSPRYIAVGSVIPNGSHSDDQVGVAAALLFFFGSLLFGAIHFAAWNYTFPTRADQLIWRVVSVWTTVFPFFLFSGLAVAVQRTKAKKPVLSIATMTYILARIALMVEVFRTLFYLPPSAFVATFASGVPHLG